MVLYLGQLVTENVCLAAAGVDILLENLRSFLENLALLGLPFVADAVSLVVEDNALAANEDLVGLAEVFCPLVRVLEAVLFCWLLFLLLLILFLGLGHVLFTVEVIKNGEILDELLDIWGEVAAAGGTGQNV